MDLYDFYMIFLKILRWCMIIPTHSCTLWRKQIDCNFEVASGRIIDCKFINPKDFNLLAQGTVCAVNSMSIFRFLS